MSKPIQITVGGTGQYDPAIGATSYLNPSLKGLEYYVEKSTVGTISEDDYTINVNGGFSYPASFQDGEIYFIHLIGVNYSATQTGYTNGFNITKVLNSLVGRIGWQQPVQSSLQVLNTLNSTSKSGRYFNDFHALVTLKNIKDNIEDENITNNQFNSYLETLQRSVILSCLNSVFNEPEYIEQSFVYERCGRSKDELITNSGCFVGYEIKVAEDFSITSKIDAVTLYFNEDKTFNLYVYQDGKKSPIWTKEVSVVAYERTVIELDDLYLSYGDSKTDKFYLGYQQNDLGTCNAIRDTLPDFEETYCYKAEPFYAKNDIDFGFVRHQYSYTNIPYGLNFEITCFRDHTQQIVRKAYLFDDAIGLQMAIKVIEQIINSTRSNANQRTAGENANKLFSEVNQSFPTQDFPFMPGLKAKYVQAIKSLNKSFFPKSKSVTVNLLGND